MNYDKIIIQRSLVFIHMFEIFLVVGYSRGTSKCLERIIVYDPTHMMSIVDPVAIDVETLRIDSECSLEKEFTELIHMNP